MLNRVILIGRTTKEPDVRYSTDGKGVAKFTLAVDRKFSKEKETDFISCVAFGKTAEVIEKFVRKGNKIAVVGRIQTGSYKGKDGNTVYTTDVMVEEVEFCESKGESKPKEPETDKDGFMNIDPSLDSELPFL